MASTERKVGRPRLPGSVKYVRLRGSVFNLWRERKEQLGHGKLTDSEFAEFLLHRREPVFNADLSSHDCTIGSIPLSSTPARIRPAIRPNWQVGQPDLQHLRSASQSNSNVDVTGESSACAINASFNTVEGNPFSVFEEDEQSDDGGDVHVLLVDSDESTSDVDACTCNLIGPFSGDHHFTSRMQSVIEQLRCDDSDDSDDNDDSDDSDDSITSEIQRNNVDGQTLLLCESMEMSEYEEDDERTLTMVEDVVNSEQGVPPVPVQEELPVSDVAHPSQDAAGAMQSGDSKKVIDNKDSILLALENSMAKLTNIGEELKEFVALHERDRYVVSVEKLQELAGSTCTKEIDGHLCNGTLTHDTRNVGAIVEILSKCSNGHNMKWVSSEVLVSKNHQNVYLNDCLLPAAILISGNNYEKFSLLCKALGMSIVSKNTFMRFQKHCAAPVIEEIWNEMNELVKEIFKDYEGVCLCGDGRNDSPGHSARYCVYTLMEHFTNVVVDFEVIDKRETGGNSTGMEKEALRRLLEKMAAVFPFEEITTDASPTIIKLVRDLKEKFPQLMDLFHSLDIWHKAKKLSKALHQAAKIKGCDGLKDWIDCVVNHFWFCSQDCEGSEEELKVQLEQKRSQKYHAEIVKEEKTYSYFPFLVGKMLQRRALFEGSFTLQSDIDTFDPKQIAPTIGMKQPPPTEELMKGPSRLKNSLEHCL